jgi:hypothetical protein
VLETKGDSCRKRRFSKIYVFEIKRVNSCLGGCVAKKGE